MRRICLAAKLKREKYIHERKKNKTTIIFDCGWLAHFISKYMMLLSEFLSIYTQMNGFFFLFPSFWFRSLSLHNTYQYGEMEWRRNVCIKMRICWYVFCEWFFFCHLAWCIFRSNRKHDSERSEINPHCQMNQRTAACSFFFSFFLLFADLPLHVDFVDSFS